MKAYIAGPLQMSQNFETLALYEEVGKLCEKLDVEAFVPHKELNEFSADPEAIFINDLAGLIKSNLIIAFVGRPSTGTGFELGYAFENDMNILALYRKGEEPSPLIIGLCDHKPRAILRRYDPDHSGTYHWIYVVGRFVRMLTNPLPGSITDWPIDQEEAEWAGLLKQWNKSVEKSLA